MKKILAVDDNPDNLITIEAICKVHLPESYIIKAHSGAEGIEKALSEKPDVILLDIIMPGMDGFETCRRLKENLVTRDIPVIMVTAIKTDTESRVKALNFGADAFVSKPIDPIELIAQINVGLRIKNAEDKLRQENRNLEETIQQRTAELAESEDRYKRFLDANTDLVFIKDSNFRYMVANHAIAGFFNKQPSELIGKTDKELAEESLIYPCSSSDQKALATLFPFTIEEQLGDKIFETTKFPVLLKNNKIGVGGILRDITERKKEQQALEESEERFRLISENTADTIAVFDLELKHTFASPSVYNLLGYTSEEVKKIGLKGFLTPESYEKASLLLSNELELDALGKSDPTRSIVFENEEIRKDGKKIMVETKISFIRDAGGRLKNILTVSSDITQKKETETNLRESETLFRNLASSTSTAIFIYQDENFFYVNNAFEKITGYNNREALHLTFWEFIHPDYRELVKNRGLERQLGENVPSRYEFKIITKQGKEVWVDFTSEKIEWRGKSAAIGSAVDITERKNAENELLKLSAAVQQSPSAVAITDTMGRPQYVNPRFTELTGYQVYEVNGKNPSILKAGDMSDEVYKKLWETIVSGKVWKGEFHNKTKNGKYYWEEASVSPIFNQKGEIINFIKIADDISDRKKLNAEIVQARNKAEESRLLFETIFEKAPVGISLFESKTGVFKKVNEKYTEIIGYSKEEMYGMDFIKISYPEDLQADLDNMERIIRKEIPYFEMEKRLIRKDGKIIYVKLVVASLADYPEYSGYSLSLVQDITESKLLFNQLESSNVELKQAIQKAEENEKRYRSVLKTALDGYWVVDETGRFLEVNQAYCRMSGYSEKQLLGMCIGDVDAIEKQEDTIKRIEAIQNYGEMRFESVHRRKDRSLYNVEVSAQLKENGQIVVFLHDITQRKKSELELMAARDKAEQNEAQLLESQRAARLGYYVFDIQRDRWISSEMLDEIFGIDSSFSKDIAGWIKIIHPDFRNEIEKYLMNDFILQKKNFNMEYKIINQKNESVLWVHDLGKIEFNKNGEPVKVIGTVQDITERKKMMEELVVARDKAEESDRLKSAFLANMSHEIRTPMNGILGFTNLLLEPDLTSEQRENFIQVIQQSGERMLDTVNDIIDISKIEAGLVDVNLSEFNLNEKMEYYFNFFEREAKKKGLYFTCKKGLADKKSIIKTDKIKLGAILTNLIKNAIKFTFTGGIDFGYSIVHNNNQSFIQFYVSDTGVGIPAHRQKAVFNRFEQADIDDKMVFEGSGLGLTITKSYVEMLSGEILLDSVVGKGSTFSFTIPYVSICTKSETDVEKDAVSFNQIKNTGSTILIVEDDEISALYLKKILEGISNAIIHASNGADSVRLFKENPEISLVLMDIKMSGMDGFTAMNEIRKLNKNVPVIAQTAYALEGDREKALKAGFVDYITKPIDRNLLIERIKIYLPAE